MNRCHVCNVKYEGEGALIRVNGDGYQLCNEHTREMESFLSTLVYQHINSKFQKELDKKL